MPSNQRGQFVVESVLLMIATIGVFIWATNQLRQSQALAKLIGGPWVKISGMIESGVWEKPETARNMHPNQFNRSISVDPNK